AYAYNIYLGTSKEKLYNCIMVYGANEYWLKILDKDAVFYFAIEAINENGISERSAIQEVK
ncbi:MAG TPA: 1,4-beta-xylanase, partial [Bacteroidales bacterium]|nr:1,4-beta-xylanase [Bacteroidales bacterium]